MENREERIDITQGAELERWSRTLGVTPVQLKAAVATVGDRAADVRDYLARQGTPTPAEEKAAAERDLGLR